MEELGIEGTEISIETFDQVANLAFGTPPNQDALNAINAFSERNDIMNFLIPLIESQCSSHAKFAAFAALKQNITKNWDFLEVVDRIPYKQFIITKIGQYFMDGTNSQSLLNIANSVLISILEEDWPIGWPDFIDQILEIQNENVPLFDNYLSIFRNVIEDVSKMALSNISSAKITNISNGIPKAFMQIAPTLTTINTETEPKYIESTFKFLDAIMPLVDPLQLLDSPIFNMCVESLITFNSNLMYLLSIFTSITNSAYRIPTYRDTVSAKIFVKIIEALIYGSPNNSAYIDWTQFGLDVIQKIINCFDAMMTKFRIQIETEDTDSLQTVLLWIIQMIDVHDDPQVQKSGFEFWSNILLELYKEKQHQSVSKFGLYQNCVDLIPLILLKIVKPYEIFYGEDTFNKVMVKDLEDSDSAYAAQRQCLIYLINLDPQVVFDKINELFQNTFSGTMDITAFQRLCWIMAAIANALPEDSDEGFTKDVFTTMFWYFYGEASDEIKAAFANEYMYMISKSTRVLSKNYELFEQITKFVIDMMSQDFDLEVIAMGVFCFRSLSQECMKKFIDPREGSVYIEQILQNIDSMIPNLERFAIVPFFECLAKIIKNVYIIETRQTLLAMLYTPLIQQWNQSITDLSSVQLDQANYIIFLLKCFSSLFGGAGPISQPAIEEIYESVISVYDTFLRFNIENDGMFPWMKTIMQSCINAIESFAISIEKGSELSTSFAAYCAVNFATTYNESTPQQRVCDIPLMFGVLVAAGGVSFSFEQLDNLTANIFYPTYLMIQENQQDFLAFRKPLIKYIRGLIYGNINYIYQLDSDQKDVIVNATFHLANSPYHDIAVDAVKLYSDFIDQKTISVFKPEEKNNYLAWICQVALVHLSKLLSDMIHKFMFDEIGAVIKAYFSIPVLMRNSQVITQCLHELFPEQNPQALNDVVQNLISKVAVKEEFHTGLRDLMISLEKLSENDVLFRKNVADQMRKSKEEEKRHVPGMLTSMFSTAQRENAIENVNFGLANLSI